MKKALSLILAILMFSGAFAALSVFSSAEEVIVSTYGNGMENWENSPNKGDYDAVTQILFCPAPWEPAYYTAGLEVTVNMKAVDGSSDDTFEATVATTYDGGTWGICRIEPCLAKTPWVPVKDKRYYATFSFADPDGAPVRATAVDQDGEPMAFFLDSDPIVPEPAPQEAPVFRFTFGSVTVPYGSEKAYIDISLSASALPEGATRLRDWQIALDTTCALTDGTVFYGATDETETYSFVNKRTGQIGATTDVGDCIATAEELLSDTPFRIATVCLALDPQTEPGTVIAVGLGEVIELTFENNEYTATFARDCSVLHDPASITIEEENPAVTVAPYADGMENWTGSPNKGDMEAVTQILFCPSDWTNDSYQPGMAVTVNMKALDGSTDDTFEATVATVYPGGDWGICRIEPCLLGTPWIPVKDVEYKATFTFVCAQGESVTVEADGVYVLHVDPIVPQTAPILYGDVNGDGKINKKDSLDMKKYLADSDYEIDLTAADVVPDGKVNKKDALRLKQYLADWEVVLGQA